MYPFFGSGILTEGTTGAPGMPLPRPMGAPPRTGGPRPAGAPLPVGGPLPAGGPRLLSPLPTGVPRAAPLPVGRAAYPLP